MFELMKFDYQNNPNKYDAVLDDKTLLNVVSRIESKIYDESFSFNTSKIEGTLIKKNLISEIKKVTSEETITSALEKARQGNPEKIKDEEEERGVSQKTKNENGENGANNSKIDEEAPGKNNKNTESLEDELVSLLKFF